MSASIELTRSVTNPFPGPKPYGRDDEYFFGRQEQIDELVSLILSSSAVVLDAPSGTGKSSLLNAGLLPSLQQEGFHVIHVQFGKVAVRPRDESGNRANPFSASVLAAVAAETGVAGDGLVQVLADLRQQCEGGHLLVLDQFEEIFFRYPQHWADRVPFFHDLGEALRRNPDLRLLIAIRSDYLASLAPYQRHLPGELVVRYSLDSLGEAEARTVVERAFRESGRPLDDEMLESVLTALVRVPLGLDQGTFRSEFVNLILLQIVCRRLWEDLGRDGDPHSPRHLPVGRVDVDTALKEFVDDAVARVVQKTGADEAKVREWLESALITRDGHRDLDRIDKASAETRADEVVTALEEMRLVTSEQRNQERWVELTHDSMVSGVQRSNASWKLARRRRRRHQQVALSALLVALGALVVLLHSLAPSTTRCDFDPSPDHLACISGRLDDRPPMVEFTTHPPEVNIVVAFLCCDGGLPRMLRVTPAHGTTPMAGASSTATSVPFADKATLVLPGKRATRYAAEIVGERTNADYTIAVERVMTIALNGSEVRKKAKGRASRFAVAVKKGVPLVVTVDRPILDVSPPDQAATGTHTAVLRADDDGPVVFGVDGDIPSVTIAKAPLPYSQGTSIHGESAAVWPIPRSMPRALGIDLACERPVKVGIVDSEYRPLASLGDPSHSPQRQFVAVNLPDADANAVIVDDSSEDASTAVNCQVNAGPLVDLGTGGVGNASLVSDVRVEADRSASGFILRTASESVVVVAVPPTVSASLSCDNGPSKFAGAGERLITLVPGDRTCTLVLSRPPEPSVGIASARVATLPTLEGQPLPRP